MRWIPGYFTDAALSKGQMTVALLWRDSGWRWWVSHKNNILENGDNRLTEVDVLSWNVLCHCQTHPAGVLPAVMSCLRLSPGNGTSAMSKIIKILVWIGIVWSSAEDRGVITAPVFNWNWSESDLFQSTATSKWWYELWTSSPWTVSCSKN